MREVKFKIRDLENYGTIGCISTSDAPEFIGLT